MDLTRILNALSQERPIFHSEADFQHALAWHIHELHPAWKVRLEYTSPASGRPAHVDILALSGTVAWPIEVKYKTKKLRGTIGDELFDLKSHGAADQARYAFFKDVQRLEAETAGRPNTVGHAVLLTNDALLWRPADKAGLVDLNFHIHEGRTASGTLMWAEHASEGTMSVGDWPFAGSEDTGGR